ncbi:Enoyl reductase LovC 3 [Seiridium cupressi]
MLPQMQTALVQAADGYAGSLPLTVATVEVPSLPSPYHVLVRVLAVALNPNDHKMITHFTMPGNLTGCDFCGVIETAGETAVHTMGTRVCGAAFPYKPDEPRPGAFAQWLAADSRLLLRVPHAWDDLSGAALGGVGWSTACLAISHPGALALDGLPSNPTEKKEPVLVYGGGTASGTMACQLLKLSGYTPLAVTSPKSASLGTEYGAAATASYTSANPVESIRSIASGKPIRHALDCITDAYSASICFGALARAGGNYACLEECPDAWRIRKAVRVMEVMGYEILGNRVDLGPSSVYTRDVSKVAFDLGQTWAGELQSLVDKDLVKPHPIREIKGKLEGIVDGLSMLQRGEVRGQKLVVRIASLED